MVEIAIGGGGELERPEADIVESLVINAERLIRVLDELMHGEGGIVRLDDGVGHLWRGHDGECAHHSVRIFLPDLGDEKGSHSSAGSASQRVGDLEPLQAVGVLCFFADNVEHGINELGTLGIIWNKPNSSWSGTPHKMGGARHLRPFAQLLPAPLWPKTKLSGRKRPPRGPERTESMVPGSRSMRTARGTYLLA